MRRRKVKTGDERLHHARVAEMPCIACGRSPVHVHHLRHDGHKGISKDHKLCLPICASHHVDGPQAIHKIGHPAFAKLFDLNMMELAQRLWSERLG